LLVAGTFAWTNFNSSIVNNFFGTGTGIVNPEQDPGGTLHNDFEEGKDYRDVYVENWGTEPLIVRIRLTEYMEVGDGAGSQNAENNHASSIVDGALIDDPNTWTPFNSDASDSFRHYWNWTMGGQKLYFPAPSYLRGTQDANGVDFVSTRSPVGTIDGYLIAIYMPTLDAEILTMAEWVDRGMPLGHYWVVDTDGYSYWAAPLLPNEATGLLLHKVELNNRPIEDFYYAINVVAHMATIDDVPDNYTRFLLDASEDATMLVNHVADAIRDNYDELPVLRFEIESFWRPNVIDIDEFWELEPVIFQSRNEARDFYNANTVVFSAEAISIIDSELIIVQDETLLDSRFDNAFFNGHALLFVPFRGDLGSSFPITNINLRDGILVVEMERTNSGGFDDFPSFPHYYIVSICRSLISDNIRVDIIR